MKVIYLFLFSDIWTVSPEDKAKHERLFQSMVPLQGKISGEKAKKEFMKSNLPTPVLGQIWMLADLDRDGRMTLQEFMIAMHLLSCKIKGIEVPRMLPPSLRSSTDPSQQAFPLNNVSMGNGMPGGGMNRAGNNMIGNNMMGNNMMGNNMMGNNMMGNNMMGMTAMQSPGMGMGGINIGMGRNPSMGGSPSMGGVSGNFGAMGMVGVSGGSMNMNQNMMMQPMIGMQPSGMSPMQPMQPMSMSSPMSAGMSPGSGFNASPGQINRVASLPANTSGFGHQSKPNNQSFTMPHPKPNQSSVFSSSNSGGMKPSPQMNALDSLAIDSLSGFPLQQGSVSPKPLSDNISAANRMRYTQMFKAADHDKTGFLAGIIINSFSTWYKIIVFYT